MAFSFFRRTNSSSGARTSGFTMVEIVAVIVIIGVLSAVIVGRLDMPDNNLSGRLEVLKSHLRYAQFRSMNSNSPFGLHFHEGTYVLYDGGNVANTHRLPGEEADLVDLSGDGYGFTTGGSETFDVSFDSWGVPYTVANPDGATPQSGDRVVSVTLRGETATLTVIQNTGFVP